SDADIALDPMALAVRPAVADGVGHALQDRRRDRRAVELDEARDAAHGLGLEPHRVAAGLDLALVRRAPGDQPLQAFAKLHLGVEADLLRRAHRGADAVADQ